ncbi:MAG: glucose 1-dehydrogenase [Chloroflexi bacterium]|nr:glucose 1-dehydrogenase [Chloroflexota bacterium]
MGKLDGKVAVITGAGSGIGRASALLFAQEGAKVVVADYVAAGGEETTRMVKQAGGQAVFVYTDVSRMADVQNMLKTASDTYGRIDVLYNNAGVMGKYVFTADMSEQAWDEIIGTNLKGVFLGSKCVIPIMLAQGGGVIVNTASTAGIIGLPGLPAYCASKAGVIQLTKTMALEYADRNIRINCICPGGIATPMSMPTSPDAPPPPFGQPQPMRRFGGPEEVARAALYLVSSDSSYVTGIALTVDGGWVAGIPKARPKK